MEFINSLIKFLTDKTYHPASRFFVIVILGVFVIIINNLIGWHFNYTTNQRLNQLRSIDELERNNISDTILIQYLDDQRKQIMERKNILEQFIGLFSQRKIDDAHRILTIHEIDSISKLKHSDSSYYQNNVTKITKEHEKSRSQIWHTLSSSISLIILYLFGLLSAVFEEEEDFDKRKVLLILVLGIIVGAFIWLFQYLLGLIPVIDNKPILNYLVNFFSHSIFILILGLILNSIETKKT